MVDLTELKPMPERKIDFGRFPAAASKSLVGAVELINKLLEVVKDQQRQINELKGVKDAGEVEE